MVNAVFADAKSVRSLAFCDTTDGLHPISPVPSVSARALVSLKSDQPIMILGGTENSTLKNLRALDHKKRHIIIAHTDSEQLARLEASITELKGEGKLKGDYKFMASRTAMDHLHDVKAVFDVVPLGNDIRDAEMLARWRDTQPPLPPLVHLKGDPFCKEQTNPLWKEAKLPNVFNIEDINAQRVRDEEHNKSITTGIALKVIENCITSRKMGRQPVRDKLLLNPLDYKNFVEGAPPPPTHGDVEEKRAPIDHANRPPDPSGFTNPGS
jgi:hypothetical protein